jgi:hypothetical protein
MPKINEASFAQGSMYTMQASHLLQEDLDETLLLCAVAWKLVTIAGELVELAIGLEAQHLELWITPVIDEIEKVDEHRL